MVDTLLFARNRESCPAVGREISGFYSFNANVDIKDFTDKHNVTDYLDEYYELYPFYKPKGVTIIDKSELSITEASEPSSENNFSDSDGDAYVDEFLMPKYVDESALPERMRAAAHTADIYVLADAEIFRHRRSILKKSIHT